MCDLNLELSLLSRFGLIWVGIISLLPTHFQLNRSYSYVLSANRIMERGASAGHWIVLHCQENVHGLIPPSRVRFRIDSASNIDPAIGTGVGELDSVEAA